MKTSDVIHSFSISIDERNIFAIHNSRLISILFRFDSYRISLIRIILIYLSNGKS